MAATERTLPLMSRLPDQVREMLSRRLRELAGLGLIALACAAALALATWSVQDPSLSHATSKPIRNILGFPGAITADLLMQTFGLGAIMLLLPVSIWGWRMLTHRHFDREALRIAFWILATVACAGFASCWPRTGTWPLPTGLGGVTGDALLRLPASLIGADGFFTRLALGIVFGAATVVDLCDRQRLGLARKAGRRGFRRRRDRGRGRRRARRAGIAQPGLARSDLPCDPQLARPPQSVLLGPLWLAVRPLRTARRSLSIAASRASVQDLARPIDRPRQRR